MIRTNAIIGVFLSLIIGAQASVYDVKEFGAVNDGATLNTQSIQKAINTCSKNGGGTVLLTGGGRFLTGTLYLKNHVTLHVDNGTVLLGSPNYADYTTDTHKIMYKRESHMDRCLIFARDARSIAIEGHGTIDGKLHLYHPQRMKPFLYLRNLAVVLVCLISLSGWAATFEETAPQATYMTAAIYATQKKSDEAFAWLDALMVLAHGPDYDRDGGPVETKMALAAYRGQTCGVRFAEAFKSFVSYPTDIL